MLLVLTLKKSSHSNKRTVVGSIRINTRCTLEMAVVRILSLHATYDMVWCIMPVASSLIHTEGTCSDQKRQSLRNFPLDWLLTGVLFFSMKFVFRADSQKLRTSYKCEAWTRVAKCLPIWWCSLASRTMKTVSASNTPSWLAWSTLSGYIFEVDG